ncbi:MAG: beta-propeller fold lactonase family protein, partial [Bryobacteraceae bacterium]
MAQKPNGYSLPNGWRISPVGKSIPTEDMLLNLVPSPDGKIVVALHGGFNPHGLVVIDTKTETVIQRIPLKSAWLGMAWQADGKRLFVSGGNANGRNSSLAPIYVFGYTAGKLSGEPVSTFNETVDTSQVYWSGLAHHPKRNILYAANRGTSAAPGQVVIFDSATGKLQKRINVEVNPYDLVLSEDGTFLFVSNWGSDSISIIDTASERVVGSVAVGDNPNDIELGDDGRLYVSCANDNSVIVVDTKSRQAVERISTALTPRSPEGSTPNGLALDRDTNILFVANADNNSVAAISVANPGKSEILGFLPTGWYPSSLALTGKKPKLYIGNSKGMGGHANIRGPHSPLPPGDEGTGSVKSLQKGSVTIVPLENTKSEIKRWTKQVYENVPYRDEFLARAKTPTAPTVLPREVGAGSPI